MEYHFQFSSYRLFLKALFLSTLFFHTLQAQTTWELKKDKNGIRVYTMDKDSSKFKRVKVECEVIGTLAKLDSILQAVENNKNWVYSTKTSHRVKTISDKEFLYYAETSMPWPLENRDVVIHMWLNYDSIQNMLFVTAKGEPNALPKKENKVRLPYFYGRYEATQKTNDRLGIVYYLEVDPGGSTAPWLVNMFVSKGPYETFYNLSKMLSR